MMEISSSTPKATQEPQTKLTPLDQARLALGLPLTQQTQKKIEEEQENQQETNLEENQQQQEIPEQPLISSTTRITAANEEETREIQQPRKVELNDSEFNGDNELNLPIPPSFSALEKPVEEENERLPQNEPQAPVNESNHVEEEKNKYLSDSDGEDITPFELPKVPSSVRRLASKSDAPKKSKTASAPRTTLFEDLKYAPKQKIAEDMGMRTLEQLFTPPTIIAKPFRKVELQSILQMRVNILENESTSLTKVLKQSHYVGFVGLKNLLLQSQRNRRNK